MSNCCELLDQHKLKKRFKNERNITTLCTFDLKPLPSNTHGYTS